MKFLTITVVMAGVLIASGCRHAYEPPPPAYYCQPACAPSCNPCAPSTTPYLQPTPGIIPRTPYTGNPAAGTYTPPGATYANPGANPQPSLPAVR
ncbi:MAG: hypothetical protein WCJ35_27140 [Planctomycetota bacterium]